METDFFKIPKEDQNTTQESNGVQRAQLCR